MDRLLGFPVKVVDLFNGEGPPQITFARLPTIEELIDAQLTKPVPELPSQVDDDSRN